MLKAFYRLNADPENIRFTGDPPFADVAEAERFIRQYDHYQKHDFGRWSLHLQPQNCYIGFCGLRYQPDTGEVDVGYRIMREYWGKGLATEAAWQSVMMGFEQYGLERITSRAQEANPASIKVAAQAGLCQHRSRTGRRGKLADLCLVQGTLRTIQTRPAVGPVICLNRSKAPTNPLQFHRRFV